MRAQDEHMDLRNNPTIRGKRLVLRFVAVQMSAGIAAALLIAGFLGSTAAAAALAGCAVVAVGNLVFGWRLFSPGVAPASRIARAMWQGEALKWIWVVLAVWLALGVVGLAPLPFLLGMLAGQIGFWIGMAFLN